jgi:CheY-like chemotaxis protein
MSQSLIKRGPFAPTVLVVDDDKLVTKRWVREFHRSTSLGVVVANSLRDAADIVEDKEVQIDAVVSDIVFDYQTDDQARHLGDGIDFLEWLEKSLAISIPKFVISASIEMSAYRQKAQQKALRVEGFFDKFSSAGNEPAWMQIQRAVIRRKFGSDSDIAVMLDQAVGDEGRPGIDLVNQAMSRLQLTVRTYIQDLPATDNVRAVKPIEAICIAKDGRIHAYAPSLGLLAETSGDTVSEALDELANAISLEAYGLLENQPAKLSDYAGRVADRLRKYISISE